MLDLISSTAAVSVLLVLLALAGLGVTVLPFVTATGTAERKGLSSARAGALTLAAVAVGLAASLLVVRSDLPTPYALLPLALCWVVPGALALLDGSRAGLGGRRGLHE